ncbi:Uma2 family endonuclease [bacterium]|nr:MAG: Uma2 family endonuclease [bacterium]
MTGPNWEQKLLTEEEYLAFEEASAERHEFWFGRVVPVHGVTGEGARAMAGASEKHVSIASESITALNNRLRGSGCRAGGSDIRVQMEDSNYAYPDVVVWCRDAQWSGAKRTTLHTPLVLIEVLSAATAHTDFSTKLQAYKRLDSLADYLIISQARVYVEHFSRSDQKDVWINRSYNRREQIIELKALGIQLPVADIYFDIDVPEQLTLWDEDDG